MIIALLSLLSSEASACGMPADYDFALAELMAEIDEPEPLAVDPEVADPLAPIPEDQRAPSEPPPSQEQVPLS
jgi:hypothetical protein